MSNPPPERNASRFFIGSLVLLMLVTTWAAVEPFFNLRSPDDLVIAWLGAFAKLGCVLGMGYALYNLHKKGS